MMARKGRRKWANFDLTRHQFFTWLGIWFRLCAVKLKDKKAFWFGKNTTSKWFKEAMPWGLFRKIHLVLSVPQYEENDSTKLQEVGSGPDRFQWLHRWVHACSARFKESWEPGTYITVDETMVFWKGLGPVHLTYMPRKPNPLGVMFKTTCCSVTRVLLHAEFVEGAAVDRKKKWVAQHKATTACTLRLLEQWFGTGKVVLGDAWFGSVRTIEELLNSGLYGIMCVKQGCSGFPRAALTHLLQQRGQAMFLKTESLFDCNGRSVWCPIFAAGHMDKQPLMVCASTGTRLPGEEEVRYGSKFVNGELQKAQYTLPQPDMHATYHKFNGAVDLFNRVSFSPGTIPDVWKTKSCNRRLFAATLSWIETNAQLAYNQYTTRKKVTKQ